MLNIKPNHGIKLINNIYNLPEEHRYYKKYKITFPVELILSKMKKVDLSLNDVLSIKDNIEYDYDRKNEKILFDYIKYLDDLNDSLLLTMKALTTYSDDHKDIREAHKWLNKYRFDDYKKFKDQTLSDNNFIRESSNNIKHNDARVNFMSLENFNNKKVYGFYISGILDENELSGPKPEIHRPYKNTVTAFSFNHFLLRTAGVVALNFYWLNKIIFNNQKSNSKPYNDNTIFNFFNKLQMIEHEFFPDEYDTKFAKIIKNKQYITIMYEKLIITSNRDTVKHISWILKLNTSDKKSNDKIPYFTLKS